MAEETLASMLPTGSVVGVRVYCRACARSHEFDAKQALARFGPRATLADIVARTKCGQCGGRAYEAGWSRITDFDKGTHGVRS